MKLILKFAACILLTGAMVFVSCKKEKPVTSVVTPPPPPPPSPDTLSGKEFVFNDLIWTLAGEGAIAFDEIWVEVANRPDLFNNPARPMEVSIKFDTSSIWMNIPKWNWPSVPANNGYLYVIMYNSSFYVESYPLNFQLIDRKASLKIKFL